MLSKMRYGKTIPEAIKAVEQAKYVFARTHLGDLHGGYVKVVKKHLLRRLKDMAVSEVWKDDMVECDNSTDPEMVFMGL